MTYIHQGPLIPTDVEGVKIFVVGGLQVDIGYRGDSFSLLHFPVSGSSGQPIGMACRCEGVPDELSSILAGSLRANEYRDASGRDPALYLFQPEEYHRDLKTVIETYLALLGPPEPEWKEKILTLRRPDQVTTISPTRVLAGDLLFLVPKLDVDPATEEHVAYAQRNWAGFQQIR